jgi:hypothetical protein
VAHALLRAVSRLIATPLRCGRERLAIAGERYGAIIVNDAGIRFCAKELKCRRNKPNNAAASDSVA